MGTFDQSEFAIRCEWGENGVKTLAPISDVIVIVDVLSFSTSVDIAASQGATVFPYRWRSRSVEEFARSVDAEVANRQNPRGYSLAPSTLEHLPENYRMVLPSPNGSQLTMLAGGATVMAGCLRNAEAVALKAMEMGESISVIACGERWHEDDSLRPSLEDILGAGSIIKHLNGNRSPEAEMAVAVFERFSSSLFESISHCSSGKEKRTRKKERDVVLAAAYNVSQCAPMLIDGAYQNTND